MPCVFPVLTLKVLGFATHRDTRPTMRQEAGAFAAGVVLTFVALGAGARRTARRRRAVGLGLSVAVARGRQRARDPVLRARVEPVRRLRVRTARALGSRRLDREEPHARRVRLRASSPSSSHRRAPRRSWAPRSASRSLRPTGSMLAVFVALGVGMALPYVLFAWFPGWRRRLPRPGPWLERFKQVLAFPLYATVIWLAWVLGAQRDNDALLRLLIALLGIAFALWAWRIVRTGGARLWGIAGLAVFAAGAIVAWPLFLADPMPAAKAADGPNGRRRRVDAVHTGHGGGADRGGAPGVRRFHRGLVRHVPGEQAARAQCRGCPCGIRGKARRPRARRLDAPRPGDHAGARRPRARTACPSTSCTAPARRRCCCRRCCAGAPCRKRWPRLRAGREPGKLEEIDNALTSILLVLAGSILLASPASRAAVAPAAPRPRFTITDTAGKAVQLADYKGKYVVLEWTNPECPFVQKHYSSGNMQALQKEWGGRNVVWLAINSTNASSLGVQDAGADERLDEGAGCGARGDAPRSTSGTAARLRREDDAAHVRHRPRRHGHLQRRHRRQALRQSRRREDREELRPRGARRGDGRQARDRRGTTPYGCSVKY